MFQSDYFNEITNKILNKAKRELNNKIYIKVYESLVKIYPNFRVIECRDVLDINEYLNISSHINEKCQSRKDLGKFYTPKDLCQFMLKELVGDTNSIGCKIIDPTCGNSEFLLSYIDYINEKHTISRNKELETLISNIYGNDSNILAITISKVRVFFKILFLSNKAENLNLNYIVEKLNENFTSFDVVLEVQRLGNEFDLVIGNPPYLEDKRKYENIPNHGNLYANSLQVSISLLKENGKLCFIIPISYVSTPRMKKIRDYIKNNTRYLKLFNFADRPSCLFTSVHQKLTILVCKKSSLNQIEHRVFSSAYNFWYKNEREYMLKNLSLVEVEQFDKFIPKIGSTLEKSIFNKIYTQEKNNSIYITLNQKDFSESEGIYLNMRATFWIKCFLDYSRSKEYKKFTPDIKQQDYLYCLLNSSLFFWFWCVISDGWHITSKELEHFTFIQPNNTSIFVELSSMLRKDLEMKKKFVNTKQIDYIYQHKESKFIIDKIDDELAKIYNLTKYEVEYIKKYAYKYRMSLGY
ncbi:MAG: N-6 DNA methylase [[Actinobacillus] rossii]|uniref:site-specific DNA-methyltransferase (adenine-specific) n=1 Tax=[Actinobacillus] rossii TaxID=123820 RepID=A0A380TNL5_9PAST|nr:N-6 DNA methylase [[Actinobacillus] rossii]MDY4506769.1 N-6 DNA methylase [[Actinobacillus] rossii]SUT89360.1 Type I restriction-modification system M subunit [[Actinobacillus] rossii]